MKQWLQTICYHSAKAGVKNIPFQQPLDGIIFCAGSEGKTINQNKKGFILLTNQIRGTGQPATHLESQAEYGKETSKLPFFSQAPHIQPV